MIVESDFIVKSFSHCLIQTSFKVDSKLGRVLACFYQSCTSTDYRYFPTETGRLKIGFVIKIIRRSFIGKNIKARFMRKPIVNQYIGENFNFDIKLFYVRIEDS